MKKKCLLTLLSCCLLSAAGNAQQQLASQLLGIKNVDTSVSEAPPRLASPSETTPTFTVVKLDGVLGKLAEGRLSEGALQRAAVRKAARKASANAKFVDSYAEFDYALKDGTKTAQAMVSIKPFSADSAYVINLYGLQDTLRAAYDLTAGTISIKPGKIYNHATYGPVWACPINSAGSSFSTTEPIVGSLAADGTVTLGSWAVLVVSGNYRGSAFGSFSKSELKPTNASITEVLNNSGTDSTVVFPAYIEQTAKNEITLMNFSNNGAVVKARVNPDKTVEIAPQRIFSNSVYGDFFCYATDWKAGKLYVKAITGQGTDTSMKFGNWGVSNHSDKTLLTRRVMSTTITFPQGTVTYPAKPVLSWTGDGSESNPYVVNNVAQLQDFAEYVRCGNNYKGKFIALGGNIDMGTLVQGFSPVGVSEEKPFEGTFDGKGFTFKNLSLSVGEENYFGIFGYAGENSVIKNVVIDTCGIRAYGTNVGLLAGFSLGKISNIKVVNSALVALGLNAGGIVGGYDGPSMTNAMFDGAVTGVGAHGGVVGLLKGNLDHSQSHGTLKMTGRMSDYYCGMGGLVGMTLPKGSTQRASITYCYNDASITDVPGYGYVGGLVGSLQTGTIDYCYNLGNISSKAISYDGTATLPQGSVGGLVGTTYGGNVFNSYASNIIINTRESKRVGGIVGNVIVPVIKTDGNGNVISTVFPSSFKNCYTSGQTRLPKLYNAQGIYGVTYSDSIFVNCYYDRQVVGSEKPKKCAVETSFLASGKPLPGFEADKWVFAEGLYPRIKGIDDTKEACLSASTLTLGAGETVLKVKHNFKVSTANGITWKLYDSSSQNFVDETTGLILSGDSVKLKDINSAEVIVALAPSGMPYKMYGLETVNPSGFLGSGTEADPYLIQDVNDLATLNKGVTTNGQNFKGDFFKQTNDIDLKDAADFTGIGNVNNAKIVFGGTYDGQGYAIHNMKLGTIAADANNKPTTKGSSQNIGLFGYTSSDATIKNVVIAADCEVIGYSNVGSVVGHSAGKIENCRNYGKVTAISSYAGGITGYVEATGSVVSCYNSGNVASCGTYAAGIAAYSKGKITYCQNDGDVRADSVTQYATSPMPNNAAGIVGFLSGATTVSHNINSGSVYAKNNVGGISAMLASMGTVFEGNINYGIVTYEKYAELTRGAVIAKNLNSKSTVKDNYYDSQLGYYGGAATAIVKGINGVSTKELTSGKVLEGLDSTAYDFVAGKYPVLKSFKDEAAAKANRSMVVTFADGNTADDVFAPATLASGDKSLVWTLKQGSKFAVADGTLSVNIGEGAESVRDTLVATVGDYSKVIGLRAMPNLFSGAGTAADPYQIKTVADMAKLADVTNNEHFTFSGRYFKVLNDIDFADVDYAPVAVGANKFDADFDGGGNKFTNVKYSTDKTADIYIGLFGNIGQHGRLHDLTLASGSITAYSSSAGFAGRVYGQIDNCVNNAAISTYKNTAAAGIAVYLAYGGTIKNCQNNGHIASVSSGSVGIVYETETNSLVENCVNTADIVVESKNTNAGIVGNNGGTIKDCVNKGKIGGSASLAGIAVHSVGGDSIINCVNEGDITGTSGTMGGIVALKDKNNAVTVITGCHNTGAVTGAANIAGIIGSATPGLMIADCYNTGDITGTGTAVGGFMGACSTIADKTVVTTVTSSYNTGNVSSKKSSIGGFVGDMNETAAVFTDCYNTGDVNVTGNFVGGFAGEWSGTAYRCYNAGNVVADGYGIGGFSGIASGEIHECFNVGDVTSTGSSSSSLANAGGLWGYGYSRIYDSYNMGTVTAKALAGGINGRTYGGAVIDNTYNAGKVVVTDKTVVSNITDLYKDNMELENCYYDSWVNPDVKSSTDERATALSTRGLAMTSISDSTFRVVAGMYPTLKCFANNELANWFAAIPVLAEGDTYNNVSKQFVVGTPEGTEWTSSDNITIKDGVVSSTALGEAWLTKKLGDRTKTYNFTVTAVSGIEDAHASAQIIKSEYYSISGVALGSERPSAAGIYVVKSTYDNGTTVSKKIVIK